MSVSEVHATPSTITSFISLHLSADEAAGGHRGSVGFCGIVVPSVSLLGCSGSFWGSLWRVLGVSWGVL